MHTYNGKTFYDAHQTDEDVLDTWFSSALFPFSIFGWPEQVGSIFRITAKLDYLDNELCRRMILKYFIPEVCWRQATISCSSGLHVWSCLD